MAAERGETAARHAPRGGTGAAPAAGSADGAAAPAAAPAGRGGPPPPAPPPAPPVLVRLERVSKVYPRGGREVRALDGIDLEVRAGGMTFVVGPSGSGKSTLLHLMGALDRPSTGRVLSAEGRDLALMSERERARYRRERVGFVFQSFHLLGALDAVDNVLVGRIPVGVRAADRARARALLERLGLGARLGHRPAELSGGEQQRVAVARALFAGPPLVLADEPTGELDSRTGGEIMELLRAACGPRSATVVVTHDTAHIRAGDRVVVMRDGRVREDRIA
ncbi:MAG: ABC transporter ATP-binding protein [Planctomycetota bacterium]|nr:MAG: ABC transporter ATP-binding protein [Planctomycetota bacterium]